MVSIKNIALVLFLAVFIGSISLNIHNYTSKGDKQYKDTLRIVFVDTIPFYKPIPKDSTIINYVTVKLPAKDDKEDNFPKIEQPEKESDSTDVVVPITQTIYEDSTYTAYVSGYRASLDSLIFRMPREVTTITTTIPVQKPKRWGVGIQLGYGVTINSQPKFVPYIGVGISYNLFSF